jgi:predicted Zn-ribbon and HTH transcriptional regulator
MNDQPLTRRQRLAALLAEGPWTFEGLRNELGHLDDAAGRRPPVALLEEDLEHLARSLRGRGSRLVVSPASCRACGFVFRERSRYHAPSRCPRCRGEAMHPAELRLE